MPIIKCEMIPVYSKETIVRACAYDCAYQHTAVSALRLRSKASVRNNDPFRQASMAKVHFSLCALSNHVGQEKENIYNE
jgi:hypothetical protein